MKLYQLHESIKDLPDDDWFGEVCPDCGDKVDYPARGRLYITSPNRCLDCVWDRAVRESSEIYAIVWMDRAQKLHPKMLEIARRRGNAQTLRDIEKLKKWYGDGVTEGIEELPDEDRFGDGEVCPECEWPPDDITFAEGVPNQGIITCTNCSFQVVELYKEKTNVAHCTSCNTRSEFIYYCKNDHFWISPQ